MNLKKLSKNSSTTTDPADLASEATRAWSRGEITPHGDYYLTAWLDKRQLAHDISVVGDSIAG